MDGKFDVLMRQLPGWFKPVLEYIAIMQSYGWALGDTEEIVQRLHDNDFIQTADSDTLRYWERLLKIQYRAGDTIEYRRERILTALNQTVPYTVWDLRARLTDLFGDDYTMTVNPQQCTITIVVTSDRYGAIDLLYDLIWDVVPAHLRVNANQQITNLSQSILGTGAFCLSTRINNIGIGES